jgi:hypothetical protein
MTGYAPNPLFNIVLFTVESGCRGPEHHHDEATAARGRGETSPDAVFSLRPLLPALNGKFPAVALRIVEP